MDDQGQYGVLPGTPDRTGVELPRPQNPYALQQPTDFGTPPTPQGLQLPSMTDFIVKQATADKKDPSTLTPDDIRTYGKQYTAYDPQNLTDLTKNGPLVHALGGNYKGTRENFELHHAYHARQALDELDKSMPDIQAYLKTLAPAATPGAPTDGSDESAGPLGDAFNAVKKTAANLGASAALPLASMVKYNPLMETARLFGSDLPDKITGGAEDALFGLSQKLRDYAKTVPQGGTGTASRIAQFAANLPLGIASLFTGGDLTGALDAVDKGNMADAQKQALKSALLNEAYVLTGGLGKTIPSRAILGGAGAGLIQEGEREAENAGKPTSERTPFDPLGAALAVGAGAIGGALTKPGEVAKGATGGAGGAAGVGGAADADALAASVGGEGGGGAGGAAATAIDNHVGNLADSVAGVTDPAELQAIHDKAAAQLSPVLRQQFTDKFNQLVKGVHADDNAPQVNPLPAEAAATPETPENQSTLNVQLATPTPAAPAAPVEPSKSEMQLPPSISRAKPKYGLDKIGFDSDVDKALYIVGGPNKSRAHNDYVDWLKNEVGLNGKQITDMSARVKAAVKDASRNNRNPDGSEYHFDVPAIEHPEFAPKPVEAPKVEPPAPTNAAVEPVPPTGAGPEPPAPPVAPVVKPRARYNPLTGKVEPVPDVTPATPVAPSAKPRVQVNPETGKVEPVPDVGAMLGQPVRAPIIDAKGKIKGSTNLKFASETDKLGYLHANGDPSTKVETGRQLRARGVRDPDAFAAQVQAQVKANTKHNSLANIPRETQIGSTIPHVMQGIPLPKKGSARPKA